MATTTVATEHDYVVTAGDHFAASIALVDSAGSPIDLTGITEAVLRVQSRRDGATPAVWEATISGSGGITCPTPSNGTLVVSKALTGVVGGRGDVLREYAYDLAVTVSGVVTTYRCGKFSVRSRVSA